MNGTSRWYYEDPTTTMADPEVKSKLGPPSDARAARFKCEACGAEQRYDAQSQRLRCDFCGATREVPRGEGDIVEHDLVSAFASLDQLPMGLGVTDDKIAKCQECGAQVHFNGDTTATDCTFCGSASVLLQEENRRLLRPESLVPFAIEKRRAHEEFSDWLSKLWFRPNDLRRLATVQELGGVYVPFWTYDAHVESSWTAEAGFYYYVTEEYEEEEGGQTVLKTREVRHTRWESAWGDRSDDYDDVLICASIGLPQEMADSLRSFDTSALVPYTPGFLAGWMAEEYAIDVQNGYTFAQRKIDDEQRERCSSDVPGDTQRALEVRSTYSQLTFKHVLLPIWIAAYRYRGEIYRFLVNGQTGEVQGKAPYSWLKITLAVLFAALLIAIAVYLARR
jgi:ribosomal protein S27E